MGYPDQIQGYIDFLKQNDEIFLTFENRIETWYKSNNRHLSCKCDVMKTITFDWNDESFIQKIKIGTYEISKNWFFHIFRITCFSKHQGYIIICSKFICFQTWHFHKWRWIYTFHGFSFTSMKWKSWFQTTKNGVPPNEIDSGVDQNYSYEKYEVSAF